MCDLCAVQAQASSAAKLALRVRSRGLTAGDVAKARLEERSIVRTWCMRGTLHLLAVEDMGWLMPLIGPVFIKKSRRRYAELGLDDEIIGRALKSIRELLHSQGPLTRAELSEQLAGRGIPTAGQAAYHLLRRAGLEGLICFGPDREGQATYVLLEDWAPIGEAKTEDEVTIQLARRYLEGHGPAGPKDLATWSGISMREARAGFDGLRAETIEVDIGQTPAWILNSQLLWLDEPDEEQPVVRLLPGYDPYLLGYHGRDLMVDRQYAKRIHPGGGLIRPTLLVNGKAAGIWKLKRNQKTFTAQVEPFEDLDKEVMRGVEEEAGDVVRFLEDDE